MKTKYLIIMMLTLTVFSCSEKENSNSNPAEIDLEGAIENAESRRKSDPNSSGGNKCLMGYQTKYDQLLTEAEILATTGFSKDVMETKYQKALNNPEYHEFIFKFKNKRMGKVKGLNREIELPDVVAVRGIKAMSTVEFEKNYKAITDEEMQNAKDALKDVTEGNSVDPDANAAMKQAEKQNVNKEQIESTSNQLLDTFKEVSKGYKVVDGLGDDARWNIVTNELMVLQNGVKFEIRTDLSNDVEKNKDVAIKLAKIILEKCK